MSAFSVDIETALGVKHGPGPLANVTSWSRTRRLDRAGDISFTTPATDERTSLLANRRYARCHTIINNVRAEVGHGIIDSIGLDTEGRGLSVGGGDLLRELAMRSAGPTQISGKGLPLLGEADAGETPISLTKALDIIEYRCNNNSVTLENWDIDHTTYRSTGSTTNANNTITAVTNISNFTGRVGSPIFGTGIPAGTTVTAVGSSTITLSANATATAAGVVIYRNQVYFEFNGESILAALIKVAELTGTHFRLGTGRQIVWLYNVQPSSGIRAVVGADPIAAETNQDICLITSLEYIKDSSELISRVHPLGGGSGGVRIDLNGTTRTAPTGYTLNTTFNFIERDAAEDDYGFNVEYKVFGDIAPTVDPADAAYTTALENARNTLFDATLEYLRTRSYLQESYRLTVTKLDQEMQPGETIRVIYRDFIDGYRWVDIDADLLILEATTELDDAGIRTPSLVVSTVDRWPASDVQLLVGMLRSVAQDQAHSSVATPHASTAGSIANPVRVRCTTAAGQSIPNNTDTVVNFGTVEVDSHSLVTNPTTAWKLTVTEACTLSVSAHVLFTTTTTWAATERGLLTLRKNGATYTALDWQDDRTTALVRMKLHGATDIPLVANDYIEIVVNQNSGGALTLEANANHNHVSIHKIG